MPSFRAWLEAGVAGRDKSPSRRSSRRRSSRGRRRRESEHCSDMEVYRVGVIIFPFYSSPSLLETPTCIRPVQWDLVVSLLFQSNRVPLDLLWDSAVWMKGAFGAKVWGCRSPVSICLYTIGKAYRKRSFQWLPDGGPCWPSRRSKPQIPITPKAHAWCGRPLLAYKFFSNNDCVLWWGGGQPWDQSGRQAGQRYGGSSPISRWSSSSSNHILISPLFPLGSVTDYKVHTPTPTPFQYSIRLCAISGLAKTVPNIQRVY